MRPQVSYFELGMYVDFLEVTLLLIIVFMQLQIGGQENYLSKTLGSWDIYLLWSQGS